MALLQLPTEQIKRRLIAVYNARLPVSDRYDETMPTHLDTVYADSGLGLLYDKAGVNALLFQKIPLPTLIDWEVDIRPFQRKSGQIKEHRLVDFNEKAIEDAYLQSVLLIHNKGHVPNFPYSAMKKFITFIRLVGLTQLTLDDVGLAETPGKLSITIAKTHPIYTGKIEVKTW